MIDLRCAATILMSGFHSSFGGRGGAERLDRMDVEALGSTCAAVEAIGVL